MDFDFGGVYVTGPCTWQGTSIISRDMIKEDANGTETQAHRDPHGVYINYAAQVFLIPKATRISQTSLSALCGNVVHVSEEQ